MIFGKGLGPANIVVAPSLPFGTQLGGANGTSVKFTVQPGGKTFDAYMYYAVDTQIAGIAPSTMPHNSFADVSGFAQSGGKGTVPGTVLGLLPPTPASGDYRAVLALLSSSRSAFSLLGKLDGGLAIATYGESHTVQWK